MSHLRIHPPATERDGCGCGDGKSSWAEGSGNWPVRRGPALSDVSRCPSPFRRSQIHMPIGREMGQGTLSHASTNRRVWWPRPCGRRHFGQLHPGAKRDAVRGRELSTGLDSDRTERVDVACVVAVKGRAKGGVKVKRVCMTAFL